MNTQDTQNESDLQAEKPKAPLPKYIIILPMVLALVIAGAFAVRSYIIEPVQTQRYVIVGHLFSIFELPVWPKQVKNKDEFDVQNLNFPIQWYSRSNNKEYYDPHYKNNLLMLPEDRFQRLVDKINEINPDAVFSLGDTAINHNRGEWDLINKYVNKCKAPWYFAPGNHDMIGKMGRGLYHDNVGYLNKNVKIRNNMFIILRPDGQQQDEINLNNEGVGQIKDALSEDADNYFIMMHHRLFLQKKGNWGKTVVPMIKNKVHYVFHGNFEEEFSRLWYDLKNKITYANTCIWNRHKGAASWRLRDGESRDHVMVLNIRGDDVWVEPVMVNEM